jgi:hypothetical protein
MHFNLKVVDFQKLQTLVDCQVFGGYSPLHVTSAAIKGYERSCTFILIIFLVQVYCTHVFMLVKK